MNYNWYMRTHLYKFVLTALCKQLGKFILEFAPQQSLMGADGKLFGQMFMTHVYRKGSGDIGSLSTRRLEIAQN